VGAGKLGRCDFHFPSRRSSRNFTIDVTPRFPGSLTNISLEARACFSVEEPQLTWTTKDLTFKMGVWQYVPSYGHFS
jgi:hypothetical protein